MIAQQIGGQKPMNDGRWSLVEIAMPRSKVVISRSLRAGTLPTQKVDAKIGYKVLNVMSGGIVTSSRRCSRQLPDAVARRLRAPASGRFSPRSE
jgi:hypothetical protein